MVGAGSCEMEGISYPIQRYGGTEINYLMSNHPSDTRVNRAREHHASACGVPGHG